MCESCKGNQKECEDVKLPKWLVELIEDNEGSAKHLDEDAVVEWLKEKVQEDIDSGDDESKKRWGLKRNFSARVIISTSVTVEARSEEEVSDLIHEGVNVSFDGDGVDEDYSEVADVDDVTEQDC